MPVVAAVREDDGVSDPSHARPSTSGGMWLKRKRATYGAVRVVAAVVNLYSSSMFLFIMLRNVSNFSFSFLALPQFASSL